MKNKKILITIKWFVNGGAEKNALRIINYMSSISKCDVDVLVTSYNLDNTLKPLLNNNITNVYYCYSLSSKLIFYIKKIKIYDVVIATDHRIGAILSLFKMIPLIKRPVLICRVINNLSKLLAKKNKFELTIFKYLLRNIDMLIAQCDGMKWNLINSWKCKNVMTVYNPLESKETITRASSNDGMFKFMYAGRFSHQKQLPLLLEAFNLALTKNKNITLTLIGYRDWISEDNDVKKKLDLLIDKYNIKNNVSIQSYTVDINKFFITHSCFILTSKFEGFPNVLIEANQAGIPVISFNCEYGPFEIINDHNGLLVDLDSVYDLSNKIILSTEIKWDDTIIKETTHKYTEDIQYKKLLNYIGLEKKL
ncbi:glycosyltransferase [Morganella psychrotolerans]|uniref:Glycosyl transferase family 1 domain-containing protein n=1 Tax=Morganella psychrotolerans TaxID=368603 RepID=A0A1B8HT14_9GAMM|nr:glycosyltransferase [Morganella psychrotolerans]OBU12769.1 hypothetical protein AYY18_14965 [Morganella psychrotolerans]